MKKIFFLLLLFINIVGFGQTPGLRSYLNTPSLYGILYNKNSWTDLSDFNSVSSGASVVSNKIEFTGGAGTYNKFLGVNMPSALEHWKITAKIKIGTISGSTMGFGIGARSVNTYTDLDLVHRTLYTTGGANNGVTVLDYGAAGSYSNLRLTANSTGVGAVANDYVIMTLERNINLITTTLRNATTNAAEVDTSYTFDLTIGNPGTNNTCNYGIYNFGQTFTLDSLVIQSSEIVNQNVMFIGDSRVVGYGAVTYTSRTAYALGQKYSNLGVNAGGGDRCTEVILRFNEIIALKPKQVLLGPLGINDVASGQSWAQVIINYDTIVNRLTANRIRVFHVLPFYSSTTNQDSLVTHIRSVYPNTYFETFLATNFPGSLQGDGTHLTPAGYFRASGPILSSNLIDFVNSTLDYAAVSVASGAVNSVSNSDGTLTVSPTTGNSVASIALSHPNTWTGALTISTAAAPQLTIGNGSSLPTNGNVIRFNYPTTGGGGITGAMAGTDQMQIGFNNAGTWLGSSAASSGREIYFQDLFNSVTRGGIDSQGRFIWGTSNSNKSAEIFQPGTNNPALALTQTLNNSNLSGFVGNFTTSGSSSGNQTGAYYTLIAGYTGSAFSSAVRGVNNVVGAGTDAGPVTNVTASIGGLYGVAGAGGAGIGSYGYSVNNHIGVGMVGDATLAQYNNAAGVSIGMAGYALRANASAIHIGGFFGLMSASPTYESGALIADNGSQTADIIIGRDNGTKVFRVKDGGNVDITGNLTLTTAGNALLITEGSNGRVGQTTLVSGTKTITITGLTASSRPFLTLVTPSWVTTTTSFQAVCTANTLTIQANVAAGTINTSDASVLNYFVIN